MKLFKFKTKTMSKQAIAERSNIPSDISKTIGGYLTLHGFKKVGQSFYRHDGELIHVINLQANRYNSKESGSFYINLGVYHGRTHEILDDAPASKHPHEADCQIRARLEDVDKNQIPPSWEYSIDTDIAQFGRSIGEAVEKYALLYFKGMSTISDLRTGLREKKHFMSTIYDHVVDAVLSGLMGEKDVAKSKLTKYLEKNSMADSRIYRTVACIAKSLDISLIHPSIEGETCVGIYFPVKGKRVVNDERKARNKLELYLGNLESKDLGYTHYRGIYRKEGMFRISFGTKNPDLVEQYIKERIDKIPLSVKIVKNDKF